MKKEKETQNQDKITPLMQGKAWKHSNSSLKSNGLFFFPTHLALKKIKKETNK